MPSYECIVIRHRDAALFSGVDESKLHMGPFLSETLGTDGFYVEYQMTFLPVERVNLATYWKMVDPP